MGAAHRFAKVLRRFRQMRAYVVQAKVSRRREKNFALLFGPLFAVAVLGLSACGGTSGPFTVRGTITNTLAPAPSDASVLDCTGSLGLLPAPSQVHLMGDEKGGTYGSLAMAKLGQPKFSIRQSPVGKEETCTVGFTFHHVPHRAYYGVEIKGWISGVSNGCLLSETVRAVQLAKPLHLDCTGSL
jgi:hypothetical protein